MSENLVPLLLALLCGGIFILAFSTLGIFLIIYSIRSRKKAEVSQAWPSTLGQVITAEVKQSTSTDDDGETHYSYYPSVEYEYQVGGQTYTGKRIAFGGIKGHGSESKAAADLARFPTGSQVTVYYNPEKPKEAVLERRAGGFVRGWW
ncbi:MAG: DUF3592 domain-containing protein [Chloroflexi bacterium]|nr:DUF3592 domain-containing protein [Chloroflexota bacterium]